MKTKAIALAGTVVLSALFGISVTGYAGQERQGEQQDHAKPQQGSPKQAQPSHQQARPQQDRPQQGQNQSQQHASPQQPRQAQQQKPGVPQQKPTAQPQQAREQQQRPAQQKPEQRPQQAQQKPQQNSQQARGNGRPQRTPEQRHFEQSAWQQHRAGNWQSDHRTWQQRGGYSGFRIPDNRYRGYFGQGHGFRIGGLPFLVVGGYPRFQYNGYWFSMVDPYPDNWAADWYDTDDVYVDYVDSGYYLYNRRYPGVGIAISISM